MPNWFWYLALALISIVVVAIVIWKTRKKLIITLLLCLASFCFTLEFTVFRLFRAYDFIPGIFHDKLSDGFIGVFTSDLFALPAFATLLAVFELGWGWNIAFALMFAGIETFFLKIGVYQQYWWKTYYTFIGLTVFFALGKALFHRLSSPHGRTLTFAILLSIMFWLRISLGILLNAILKTSVYYVKWLELRGIESTAITAPLGLIIAAILTSLIVFRTNWFWKAIAIVGFFAIDLVLVWLNIKIVRTNWDYIFVILENVLVLLTGLRFANLLSENEVAKRVK